MDSRPDGTQERRGIPACDRVGRRRPLRGGRADPTLPPRPRCSRPDPLTHDPMPDASPDLTLPLPRELAAELLAIARGQGAEFAEVYAERAVTRPSASRRAELHRRVRPGPGRRRARPERGADRLRLRRRLRAGRPARGRPRRRPHRVRRPARRPPRPSRWCRRRPRSRLLRRSRSRSTRRPRWRCCGAPTRPRAGTTAASRGGGDLRRLGARLLVANSDGLWAEDRHFLSRLTVTAFATEGDEAPARHRHRRRQRRDHYFSGTRTPEQVAREAAGVAVTLLGAE